MTTQKLDPVDHTVTLILQANELRARMVILQNLGQKKAILVLQKLHDMHPIAYILLTGAINGVLVIKPALFRELLRRSQIEYTYEESRNLFRFLKRLIEKVLDGV